MYKLGDLELAFIIRDTAQGVIYLSTASSTVIHLSDITGHMLTKNQEARITGNRQKPERVTNAP